MAGGAINYGNSMPAQIAFKVGDEDIWIVGALDNGFLKMVKIQVTGANTYNWISSKYRGDATMVKTCFDNFRIWCFVGTDQNESAYRVKLVAEEGIKIKQRST